VNKHTSIVGVLFHHVGTMTCSVNKHTGIVGVLIHHAGTLTCSVNKHTRIVGVLFHHVGTIDLFSEQTYGYCRGFDSRCRYYRPIQ
jgi:hypothetical protein